MWCHQIFNLTSRSGSLTLLHCWPSRHDDTASLLQSRSRSFITPTRSAALMIARLMIVRPRCRRFCPVIGPLRQNSARKKALLLYKSDSKCGVMKWGANAQAHQLYEDIKLTTGGRVVCLFGTRTTIERPRAYLSSPHGLDRSLTRFERRH